MSFLDGLNQNGPMNQPPPQAAGTTDIVIQLQGIVRQLTALVNVIKGRVVSGSFTMTTGVGSFVVTQPSVQSQSTIGLTALNADAAAAQRTNGIYISTIVPGTSFTIATQTGVVSGTPQFSYTINTPT